jgi:hypothetical protein
MRRNLAPDEYHGDSEKITFAVAYISVLLRQRFNHKLWSVCSGSTTGEAKGRVIHRGESNIERAIPINE